MDDRNLREYAENIYKGIRGYTLSKALSLFPKYYPKIVFYYTEMLSKQQNEFSLRMIQSLGIDKGRALLNELNILNERMSKFYVNAKFKLDQSYRRIEAAKDEHDRYNIISKEMPTIYNIYTQSYNITTISTELFDKIVAATKIYNFKSLDSDIDKAMTIINKASIELVIQNRKFLDYLKQYQFKE